MRILLAQMNSSVGDFEGNYQKMASVLRSCKGVDLVAFPECALCGYPVQDLLEYSSFLSLAESYEKKLIEAFPDKAFVFGNIARNPGAGRPVLNTAVFVDQGQVVYTYAKRLLPTYDVFDEDRFFEAGQAPGLVEFRGKKLALSICEDLWNNEFQPALQNRYAQKPLLDALEADFILNLSASPFEATKRDAKFSMLQEVAKKYKKPLLYVASVGANDSLIFDGRSYCFNATGKLTQIGKAFEEDKILVDLEDLSKELPPDLGSPIADIYDALVLGIRDYCQKSGFKEVVLGLSGGIDSAVVACLASDALGAENVVTVMMPSRFTSKESNEDALMIAKAMQNPLHILLIEEIYSAALRTMELAFEGKGPDITEENMQSRVRGMILMSLSNKHGYIVLSTGNKSELAVGYCTLYGDMNGGLAPLADVYKTQVYELGREANRRAPRIPERVFTKAPTAELRPNQTDQDSLPEYKVLDEILKEIIEGFKSKEDFSQSQYPPELVSQILKLVSQSEYKRKQMPLGLKVSSKAFGVGRRTPIVQRFF